MTELTAFAFYDGCRTSAVRKAVLFSYLYKVIELMLKQLTVRKQV